MLENTFHLLTSPHLNLILKAGLDLFITKKPYGISLDVTSNCNLHCTHCYWWESRIPQQLTDEAAIGILEQARKEGMVHCTFVGGEPYLRADLLEKLTQILPSNWVVTNGWFPLRNLTNTTQFVSIDGSERTHDLIRQKEGLYRRIKQNLANAKSHLERPVYVHVVLVSPNFDEIEVILEEWRSSDLVNGIIFSVGTPIKGINNDLWLNDEQRIDVVRRLLLAKEKYGEFIRMSKKQIGILHPDRTKQFRPDRCLVAQSIRSIASDGTVKPKCIFGEDSDCTRCGCSITTIYEAYGRGFDLETARLVAELI